MTRCDTLVSCDGCGIVFEKRKASDFIHCPVCDTTAKRRTPIPGVGRIRKWWSEVEP